MQLSWFYWDPNPEAFRIPILDLPVYIYGILFVLGFVLGFYVLLPLFTNLLQRTAINKNQDIKKLSQKLLDRLTWFVIGGTIIGARLGHVIFYDWDRYKHNLLAILNTREGGLASHIGVAGVIVGLILFHRYVLRKNATVSFLQLLDLIVIPGTLIGCFIRIGNFFNQEIVGIPTNLPWAVVFGHPTEGMVMARHPVQLYEAMAYLFTFCLLYTLWLKRKDRLPTGLLSGLCFVLVFTSRFFIEYWKAEQTAIIDQSYLQMGQLLSLPFILLGVALLFYAALANRTSIKAL